MAPPGDCPDGYTSVPAWYAPEADSNGDELVCELMLDEETHFTDNDQ